MVAAVASDDPQMAENMPQAAMVDIASPPLRWPRNTKAARYSSRAMPPRSTKSPIRMNIGNTDNSYF